MDRKHKWEERFYEQKKSAYLGLLEAWRDASVHPSKSASNNYALYQVQCELFGSDDVAKYSRELIETNDGPREDRDRAVAGLIEAMKVDLKSKV